MDHQPAEAEPSTSSTVGASLVDTSKPSQNELLLSRRLLQVQQERDNLAAELARMKLEQRQQQHQQQIPPRLKVEDEALTIPPPLVPVLALLRSHITDLTRDNEALRYTFLGSTSTSHITSPNLHREPVQGTPAEESQPSRKVIGVDLEEVLKRVKVLVKENEELGEMVLEAGRSKKEDWQQALDQSAQLITSLDADLEDHLGVIQSLQERLATYEARFGQLSRENTKDIDSTSHGQSFDSTRDENSSVPLRLPPSGRLSGKEDKIKEKERVATDGLSRRGCRGGRERGSFGYRGRGRGGVGAREG